MKDIKQHIKKVLIEEKGDDKVNLAKSLIYDLFDEVSHVEQSKFKNKPLLFVYFDSDKTEVNVEPWFDKLISKTIMEYTGDHVVVCPYWREYLDYYKTADVYISSLKLKNDKLGNVIKEEKEDDKVNLVKSLIYGIFDEVSSIEVSEFDGKPLLDIYFDSDDPAANIESWFDEVISKKIMEYTGNNIIVLPNWKFHWDDRKNNVDIYINTIKNWNDINEEKELNERCWKGYTQKGMKTMFGKRYPNCVKIKKKKTMKESIRNILLQEVNKKYSKPTEKVDKLVYNWLDNYFDGSQIYKHESWKHWSYNFEFCKNGREIASLHVDFDDKSPDWGPRDKRPTNERSFEESKLFIYPVMINELLTDIPIRKNYLLYLIEEWFEDTKLNEIQQGFNRNDFSLDKVIVFESKKRGDICVPPVSKPEGVTMQEMMDYIKKTTLYSYKQMEEKEEEEPGWTEELYLAKLRGKERERLNQEDRENNPEPFNDDY